ncbi:MAG: ADP-ribosylglycohydrolase family protein, partial [Anaerohalosphaera sp.]|nr:ADP-ribosylglycohydrolase family protein [Anaerohalosphaera sp.]
MSNRRIRICSLFFLVTLSCSWVMADENTILSDDLYDKIRGMWLGQQIGNNAGRSSEGRHRTEPNPADSVPWVIKLQWDADDDTDIEYIAIHILETNGLNFTNEDLALQWLDHITLSGIYISNRQALFLMRDGYLPPQTGSRSHNMQWFSIDSQITTEVLGAINPGMPQQAIDITGRFAHVSNEGFPVHAAQLYAAMYASSFFESNVVSIVIEGLKAIPVSSRTFTVANDVLKWYLEDAEDGQLDWRNTRKKLYDNYSGAYDNGRYYYWIESTVNTGATILSILYGGGDFKDTIQIGVLAGWDSDCNPATAAGLIGLIEGYSGLPSDLTDPSICGDVYKNIYRPRLPDENAGLPQYDTISNIAKRIADLAEQNILANGGSVSGTGTTKLFHIPIQNSSLITEPEKPDPNGPSGLVADALSSGLTVT